MRLNHKKVAENVCKKFWLTQYKESFAWQRFTYFKNGIVDIWFIEQIPAGKYMRTIYCKFYDYHNVSLWKEIEDFIVDEYRKQKKWQPVDVVIATQSVSVAL